MSFFTVRLILLFCIIVSAVITLTFIFFGSKPHVLLNKVLRLDSANGVHETKTILYFTKFFAYNDMALGLGTEMFESCRYKNCLATNDSTLMPIEEFDAVFFHARQYYKRQDFQMPSKRSAKQLYGMVNLEPPVYTYIQFMKDYPDFFNVTITYRRDSDVPRPYGYFVEQETDYEPPTIETIASKTRKIAWFVSRCTSESKREVLVKELSQFIPVDVYGKCGTFYCPRSSKTCYNMIEKRYKFYLSFENSVCDEYVTEKFFNLLQFNIVPIVYGGAKYRDIAPPKSYIDVRDFQNVRDLANFLNFLDETPEEYLRYFEWKKRFEVRLDATPAVCRLCERLNQPMESRSYHDIVDWWYGNGGEKCPKINTNYFDLT